MIQPSKLATVVFTVPDSLLPDLCEELEVSPSTLDGLLEHWDATSVQADLLDSTAQEHSFKLVLEPGETTDALLDTLSEYSDDVQLG